MSRASRLLELLEVLRVHRRPVAGRVLARELGVSLRTLYRDIASLQAQGAVIEGAAGLGYVLRPGFTLPPLMFRADELEALALGCLWASRQGDPGLEAGARAALARISAVLPPQLKDEFEVSSLLLGPQPRPRATKVDLSAVRRAIRTGRKLRIAYRDGAGRASRRVVWPFAIGFFDRVRVVAAWCETRSAFRHFRADRIASLEELADPVPRRRRALLHDWRQSEGIGQPQ